MKKHELLVPAGNMECLKQAVFNGCDAVYVACKSFGARKFANNFTREEIVEAIRFCHLYGVKIYVTMNTLVKNSEVASFLEQADFLHKEGVDALIVQDFGMICLLRNKYPNLEIHASTQANISSYEVCQLYHDLGVKRVVFSRELSLEEIEKIDVDIEKEVFIHGALCVSYSGCCLMSSMLGGRSGNRGECAGVCRMPFSLEEDGKIVGENEYLLSTKELNTSICFDKLVESNICSFKIEGRMKSPLYVGFITNFYRHLLDGTPFNIEDEMRKLKTIFNREFTKGRLFRETDSCFINPSSPNHIGLLIGKVIAVFKTRIKIKLFNNCSLNQYDGIRFKNSKEGFIVNRLYDKNDNFISSSDNICFVDNNCFVEVGDLVLKTSDYLLEKEYAKVKRRLIDISFKVKAHVDDKLFVEISDGKFSFFEYGNIVTKALKKPIAKKDIESHLNRLGNTPFSCVGISMDVDEGIFIPLHDLNEIRRRLVNKLSDARTNLKKEYLIKDFSFTRAENKRQETGICCTVFNEEQLLACIEERVDKIYVVDKYLYEKYKGSYSNLYYNIPRCRYNVNNLIKEKSVVADYGLYKEKNVRGHYGLNVTNIYTAYFLQKIGFSSVCLSVELTLEEILEFLECYKQKFGYGNFEVFCYGRVENMIIKGNILSLNKNQFDYYLIDSKKRKFPVYYDGVLTHILNWENKDIFIDKLLGICSVQLSLFDEKAFTIKRIINKLNSVQK